MNLIQKNKNVKKSDCRCAISPAKREQMCDFVPHCTLAEER
jgi:hypothetical protein